MLFTLLAAALAHAPVNETLERLDVSVAEEARRSAHLHLHQQRATDALAVLHADDHSPEAELLRAEAGILLGRPDARSRLDRLLDTAPRRVQARALDLRAGLHTDPIAAWNDVAQAVLLEATPDRSLQAAALAPNPPAALAILAHSRDKLGPSVSIDHALSRAWLAVDAPESALAVLSGTTGQTTEGRLLRADALEQAGRGEAALDLRSELLADLDRRVEQRDSPLLHLARARCLLALDRTADARALLLQVLEAAPDLASARTLLASMEPV